MATRTVEGRRPTVARGPAAAVLVLAGLAWVVLAGFGHGGHAADHHLLGHDPLAAAPAVLAGWVVMVVAMMLPPTLPLASMLQKLVRARSGGAGLLAVGLLGVVAVWVVVGAVLVAGDAVLHAVVGHDTDVAVGITGAVLVLAGLYQFSPLKAACLRVCRAPRWFARAILARAAPGP